MSTAKPRQPWTVIRGEHPESGQPEWYVVPKGRHKNDGWGCPNIWGTFGTRTAALACIAGYRAIGFVPYPKGREAVKAPPKPAETTWRRLGVVWWSRGQPTE